MRNRAISHPNHVTLLIVALFAAAAPALADPPDWDHWLSTDEGFEPLFNGDNLDGWINVNGGEYTYFVRDDMIVTTGKPFGVLRTDRHYENYILELEYRHVEQGGNAGLFLWSDPLPARGQPFTRSIEVQVLDGRNTENYTSHGDIFSIHGSTLQPLHPHPNGWERALPQQRRANPAGHWNHYRVIAWDGHIKLAVNGKLVTEAEKASPRKGYICLEAEGAETHFRNLRIRELPSTRPAHDEVANTAQGFRTLYNGLNLLNWAHDADTYQHWQVDGWVLSHQPGEAAEDLRTEQSFDDFELIVDWRWADQPTDAAIAIRGDHPIALDPDASGWNRYEVRVEGDHYTVTHNGASIIENAALPDATPPQGPITLPAADVPIHFGNLYIRPL